MPAKKKAASQPSEHPLADLSMMSTDDVHRLLKSDPDFPRPIRIRNQPYWLVSELRTYLKTKADERPSARRAAKTSSTTAAA